MSKELIKESYEMGLKAFGVYGSASVLYNEFMQTMPRSNALDDDAFKLRVKMYKAYIKGWTEKHLESIP